MKEIISTITSKGQVTIPVEVRNYLGLKTNDKVAFVIDSEGTVQLKVPRYPTIASLRGAAGNLNKPLSWQQVQEIAHEDRLKANHRGTELRSQHHRLWTGRWAQSVDRYAHSCVGLAAYP